MARTKQTARKTPKEGDPVQAHSLRDAIAASFLQARLRVLNSIMEQETVRRQQGEQQGQQQEQQGQQGQQGEQQVEHEGQQGEQQAGQEQEDTQQQKDQVEQQEKPQAEEQQGGNGEQNTPIDIPDKTSQDRSEQGSNTVEKSTLNDQPQTQQEVENQGQVLPPIQEQVQPENAGDNAEGGATTRLENLEGNIFRDLGNLVDECRPGNIWATRTPLPDFVLEEQDRLAQIEDDRMRVERAWQVAEEEARRLAEEEVNRKVAEDLQRELDQRTGDQGTPQQRPIKMRVKSCAKKLSKRKAQGQPSSQEENPQAEEAQRSKSEQRKKFKGDAPSWTRRPPPPPPPRAKRKYKYKPGTVALREIRRYQKSTDPLMQKAPFARVVREVMEEMSDSVTRIQSAALGALQEATEDVLVSVFQDSVLCHIHAKRVTVKTVDMALALRIRQEEALHKHGHND